MKTAAKTLCPYCGVGCGLEVVRTAGLGSPLKLRGDKAHPSSRGALCLKGATLLEVLDRDRLQAPQYRASLDQPWEVISWEHALDVLVTQLQTVREHRGPDAICMYGSGQLLTEDYYVAQKLMKGGLGTNNFDANSRLCMASAVAGYIQSLGSDGPPCAYEDLEIADTVFIVGSNLAECHPVTFTRLRREQRKRPDLKVVVVDPRRTRTAAAADVHLPIRPGTDIDLFHGLAHLMRQWEAVDRSFVEHHTEGVDAYAEILDEHTPKRVAQRCGIEVSQLEHAARLWVRSNRALSLWSMGLNQSSEGTAKVRALINLHLLTGSIGHPGSGPFSLTGQPNAMGGREAGGLAHLLPGYRSVANAEHRREVETHWGLPPHSISPHPGRTAGALVEGLEADAIGVVWVVATNPAVSMPDVGRVRAALGRSPFTVYQEAYAPTEMATYAHLLLPAAQWGEKTGTMTNSERVVTLCPRFRDPPGQARADWEIFAEVGRRLGLPLNFNFEDAAAVYQEFVALTRDRVCDVTGLSHQRLAREGPLAWPLPEGASAQTQSRLYQQRSFPTPNGRARFAAHRARGLAEPVDADFPLVLTTGRLYAHWHTQTRTGRIPRLQAMHPVPTVEVHPQDAGALGIKTGHRVELRSRRGRARFQAAVTPTITQGTVFVPFHFGPLWADDAEANALTHSEACPDSRQPELKASAVCMRSLEPAVKPREPYDALGQTRRP